jgi:hypothetical protein
VRRFDVQVVAGAERCVAELRCGEERKVIQSSWDFNTLIPTKCFKCPSTIAGVETERSKRAEAVGGSGRSMDSAVYTVFSCP